MPIFVGQSRAITRLRMLMLVEPPPNVLIRGGFGSGKTELGRWYAHSIDPEYMYYTCDGAAVHPPDSGVVFLDEIHKLRPQEAWYQFVGTIVGATTEGTPMSDPMRSRFTEIWLEEYTPEELAEILSLRTELPTKAIDAIVSRCRLVPRIALNLGMQVSAFAKYFGQWPEDYNAVLETFGYYVGGYTRHDLDYLKFVTENSPISLETIVKGLNLPVDMVRNEIEPFLIRNNRIKITSKGRCINELEAEHCLIRN